MMANPVFNALGGNQQNNPFANMVERFNQFKSTFKGSPKDEVQRLLNSGEMTQEQFNQLQVMANQFMSFMGKK